MVARSLAGLLLLAALALAAGAAAEPMAMGHAAPSSGAAVVVPPVAGPLACGLAGSVAVQLAGGLMLHLAANATTVQAVLMPARPPAFLAVALATGAVARSLVMMAPANVTLHDLGAFAANGSGLAFRAGLLGLPDSAAGGAMAGMDDGPLLSYGGGAAERCGGDLPGVRFPRTPGVGPFSLVVLQDDKVAGFLPHPLPSTNVTELRVSLTGASQAAPSPGLWAGLAVAAVLARRSLDTRWRGSMGERQNLHPGKVASTHPTCATGNETSRGTRRRIP